MSNSAAQVLLEDNVGATSQHASKYPNFARAFEAEPERKWQSEVQKRLLTYAKLPRGWDTYGAQPIGWDAGLFALSILNDFMRPRTPIPQVVPSSAGGVQLEWHQKGVDLELHVTGPYHCELWFKDHLAPNDPPVSLDLTAPEDYSALSKPFNLLSSR
jgi:hypothetical protein